MSDSAAIPGDPGAGADALAAFRRLLESAANPDAGVDDPVLFTDRLLGRRDAQLLRSCAVPHEFDAQLLAWLGGTTLNPAAADAQFAHFADLSLMEVHEQTLSVHERWRKPLWAWWLQPAQRADFVQLSERLVDWFTRPAAASGEDANARKRMFHLLGCRPADGLQAFEQLFRTARHRRRFSECSLLLGLVREYTPVLAPAALAQIDYCEGKLAIDLRQWERALPSLMAAAAHPQADAGLRMNAQVRVAHALRHLGRHEEALAALGRAFEGTAPGSGAENSRWRVLYERGELERDNGNLDEASADLAQAIALVDNSPSDDVDVAGLHNSLGTVQLKLRELDRAVASFETSLNALRERGDALRTATVLNNLGLARLERCDWNEAETAFADSLHIKRESGDRIGQATTLLNLSRARAAQSDIAGALAAAEQSLGLFDAAGEMRGRRHARQALAKLRLRLPDGAPTAGADATGGAGVRPTTQGLKWWVWLLVAASVLLLLAFCVAAVSQE